MRYLLVFAIMLFSASAITAQDKTYEQSRGFDTFDMPTVMVLPFEDHMFLSDINREIGNRTGMNYDDIRRTFREGLIQTIVEMGSDYADFLDPYEMDEEEIAKLFRSAYSGMTYDYNEVVALEEVKDKGLLDKIKENNEEDQTDRGVFLDEGQIKTWYDGKERFMDASFNSSEKIDLILEDFGLDYLLVINELDIKVMRDIDREAGQVWPRRIKIHFTIFGPEGEKIFGSAAYSYYEGEEKDIYTIIRKSFDYPVAQIISKIPGATVDVPEQESAEKEEEESDEDEGKPFKFIKDRFQKED